MKAIQTLNLRFGILIAAISAVVLFSNSASAQILVDFYNGSATNQTPGTSAAVGPDALAGWYNEVDPSLGPNPGTIPLVNNSNGSTTATFGFNQGGNALDGVPIYNSSHDLAGSANGTLTADQQLFNGAVGATGNAATGGFSQELILQNIPYASYSVYLIVEATGQAIDTPPVTGSVQNFNGGTALGAGTTYYFSNTFIDGSGNNIPAAPVTYAQATSTDSANPTVGANYVLFSNLTSANETFDLLQTSQPASYQHDTYIGGFEIVATAAPEPSTWALLFGGLGLLTFWQTHKRQRLV